MAEREGFEPPEGCPSTVFKTAAFDRSAISPQWVSVKTEIYIAETILSNAATVVKCFYLIWRVKRITAADMTMFI